MSKVVRWLLVVWGALALLSAICFAVQGGFGAGHGNLDSFMYLVGLPWTAIPWPPSVMRSDVIWLIVLPFALDLAAIVGIAALLNKRKTRLT